MFNEKRIEEIRKKIQISTILSDHEKSDWLNLLELMNDKQLSELEEILGAMSSNVIQQVGQAQPSTQATPTPRPVPSGTPVQKMPPLSHIANIPTDVNMTHTVPQTATRPTSSPATPSLDKKPQVKADIAKLSPKPVAPPAKPTKPAPSATPKPQLVTPALKKLTISQPSEIQAFDVSTLRVYELQSVVDAIRTVISQHGYFHVLQQLEASPLYRSYIETGKFLLGHGTATVADPETTLTQTEFEFITDLLRHMRFNTW